MLGPWHAKPSARLPRTNCLMLGFKLVVTGECYMDAVIKSKVASVFFLLCVFGDTVAYLRLTVTVTRSHTDRELGRRKEGHGLIKPFHSILFSK
jgi:hypothetical protein